MEKRKRQVIVNRTDCVACGVCSIECRKNAIQIYRGCYALIDSSLCVGCGLCEKNCPAGAIKMEAAK